MALFNDINLENDCLNINVKKYIFHSMWYIFTIDEDNVVPQKYSKYVLFYQTNITFLM